MGAVNFGPDSTQLGLLPPWQVALAVAYHNVLETMASEHGAMPHELVGQPVTQYIAARLQVKGGGRPTPCTDRPGLPQELDAMKRKYGWSDVPRVVVHDKAPHMVTWAHQRLNAIFAGALRDSGFTSWVGDNVSTEWLVRKFGEIYPHETVNAHARRLLDEEFPCKTLSETHAHFRARMQKVEDFMNSPSFAAPGGSGLAGLGKELRPRCQAVVRLKGERVPK